MPKDVILTPEGLQKLKDELEELSGSRRREVAQRIKEAREFGDISENSEYDDAKNEQAMLEQRIMQLAGAPARRPGRRRQGRLHRRRRRRLGRQRQGREGQVASSSRSSARPRPTRRSSKLSNESPVGKALMGHKRGEEVTVVLPNGKKRKFKITKIDVGL